MVPAAAVDSQACSNPFCSSAALNGSWLFTYFGSPSDSRYTIAPPPTAAGRARPIHLTLARLAAPAGASLSIFDGPPSGGTLLLSKSGKVFLAETVTATSGNATIAWKPPPGPLMDDSVHGDFQVQWGTGAVPAATATPSPAGSPTHGALPAGSPAASSTASYSSVPTALHSPAASNANPPLASSGTPLPSAPPPGSANGTLTARVWLPFRPEFNAAVMPHLSPHDGLSAGDILREVLIRVSVDANFRVVTLQDSHVVPTPVMEVLLVSNSAQSSTTSLSTAIEVLVGAAAAPSAAWAAHALLGKLATSRQGMSWAYETASPLQTTAGGLILELDRASALTARGSGQTLFVPLLAGQSSAALAPPAPVFISRVTVSFPGGPVGIATVELLGQPMHALGSRGVWVDPLNMGTGVWVYLLLQRIPASTSTSVQAVLRFWGGQYKLSAPPQAEAPVQLLIPGGAAAASPSPPPPAASASVLPPFPSAAPPSSSMQPSEPPPAASGAPLNVYGATVWMPLRLDDGVPDLLTLWNEAKGNTEDLVLAELHALPLSSLFVDITSFQESAELPTVALRVFIAHTLTPASLAADVEILRGVVSSPPPSWDQDPVLRLLTGEVTWRYEAAPQMAATPTALYFAVARDQLGTGQRFYLTSSTEVYVPLTSGATVLGSFNADVPIEYASKITVMVTGGGHFSSGGLSAYLGPAQPYVPLGVLVQFDNLPADMPDTLTIPLTIGGPIQQHSPGSSVVVVLVIQLAGRPTLPSPSPSPGGTASSSTGTECGSEEKKADTMFAVGALTGAGGVLLLLAGVLVARRFCSCCCCTSQACARSGFQAQVDEPDDGNSPRGSPRPAPDAVTVEMTAQGGGASAGGPAAGARLARQERSASPDESQSLIKREEESAAAASGDGAGDPPLTRLTRSSSTGRSLPSRQDSAGSCSSVVSTQHSLQLSRTGRVTPADFETRWEDLRTLDIVGGTLAKGVKGGESELEAHLTPLRVRCIASGVVNGVTKQYFYALDAEDEGCLFAAEITVTHSSGHVSALIKGPVGDKGVEFANILTSRLRVLLQ